MLRGIYMMTIDTHGQWVNEFDQYPISHHYLEFWWLAEADIVQTLPKVTQ